MTNKRTKSDSYLDLHEINNTPHKQRIQEIIKRPKEKFLTKSQEEYWDILDKNKITLCFGPSGTGKSHIALKKAIDLLWSVDNKYDKLIIVRPAIESDGETLGSLPGSLDEKMVPYIGPFINILNSIIGNKATTELKKEGFIEVMTINYLRGWSINNSILVGEEFQNATISQMKLLLTRFSFNSKFFISGDIEQSDRFKDITKTGLYDAKKRLEGLKNIGVFEFGMEDIVRDELVGEILKRYAND